MSIAVLTQVYDEAKRLAVAGSVVAPGDFRLKKLIPPLEQAGAKAPVFAKVAEAAKAVVEGPESGSAESLLELTSLVTAILYTQGETGLVGDLQPIESVDLGTTTTQTTAKFLKPLLEALQSTGGGRLDLVRDAHERGQFRDLRLVKPALNGLDDPYSEIGEFLADKVLPMYGKAILPELKAKYDPKGAKGHPRRLKLMHQLDAAGSRDLVKQALDGGSKEVKVAAIECLGGSPEDLAYLIEQAGAKAQDVRRAAYHALSTIDDAAAVAVLEKGIEGKDLELVSSAIGKSVNSRVTELLLREIRKDWAELPKAKDKKQASRLAGRLVHMVHALPARDHAEADALTLELFQRRAELQKAKGETLSGSDVAEAVIARMSNSTPALQATLARAHASLEKEELAQAVHAGRSALPPEELYELFAPYCDVTDSKKKGKDSPGGKRDVIVNSLSPGHYYWYQRRDSLPRLDGRWLDLGVKLRNLNMVQAAIRPGHSGALKFLDDEFEAAMGKRKTNDDSYRVLSVMIEAEHPRATDALVRSFERTSATASFQWYWHVQLVPQLPKTAIPQLEALVPKLKDREADALVSAIQQLRDRK